ncbi:MAG: bifunctional diaminohydroxyphosphoribosylaminopyrimidine deaminase/5-amino-6-(5-phosphoribosylamino)uracil reductase RibD [Sedimentisphaerales bacterium]|nr:bifunctional diaminohydroxyphosphoribosylaminopyrimidine deaminase/5-amino-6-(5-phosphoribosylamino)uracil reductase RibD [Sedimentisphaerales bacterium]
MTTGQHQDYMQRALELAAQGIGSVEPNPAVGCVVVKDRRIIGQGFHQRFGGPHAEINALADCRNHGFDPAGAMVYVTLEPCCHTGKTGPCTQALIEANVGAVVAAVQDPSDKIAGKGFDQLRQAGIDVTVGVCEAQARRLNAPFFKFANTGRPWVIAKWAQSIDGKLSWRNPPVDGNWISGSKSRQDVHQIRRRCQAILVGVNTIISDNPRLTVRIPGQSIERQPLRVVLDTHLRTPIDCHLTTTAEAPTLIAASEHAIQDNHDKAAAFREAGVELLPVNPCNQNPDLPYLLTELGRRGIQQLLVEGGPTVLSSFITQHLADELCVYIAPLLLGQDGIADMASALNVSAIPKLCDVKINTFEQDIKISALLSDDFIRTLLDPS